ncbi:MAG: MoaD/ThiS family protein [Bacteroidota bacterium]|jgi:molybdopterin synthase sulfur carrier subunit|nr:MoaD/ThiS family protein [Haliscomenobacter sp.]
MRVKAFGIAKEILGNSSIYIEPNTVTTVRQLKDYLYERYPEMLHLNTMAIAVNQSYATDDTNLTEEAEIVIIPPVSGG